MDDDIRIVMERIEINPSDFVSLVPLVLFYLSIVDWLSILGFYKH
ncbi:MAG: hypothetical protein Q6363_005610 [Candidatus Njordarchaeota archaeon]